MLPCVEVAPSQTAIGAVIWLHGFGADGHDFEPIVTQLQLPATLPLRFVFPHAPHRQITMYNGMTLRAWYDFTNWEEETDAERVGIYESRAQIEALIKRENNRGITSDKIVLAGFSQGGTMALDVGLRYPEKLAGIMALSTYLSCEHTLEQERSTANARTPIFMAHGTADEVVSIHDAEHAHHTLKNLGYDFALRRYPMAHAVHPQEIIDIRNWLINDAYTNSLSIAD